MGLRQPKTSLPSQGNPLDLAIEASLRRQFQIPLPLANPGASVPLTKWEWPTLNVELRLPRLSLRAAAGLLLAATLWGASGLLVLKHVNATTAGPWYMAAAPHAGDAITSRPALVGLGLQFARPGGRGQQSDEEYAVRQMELWAQLDASLMTRYGEEVAGRLQDLRESDDFELVAVRDGFYSNESLLMIAARVDGDLSVVLLEQTEGVSRLALPEERRQSGSTSSYLNAQLFRGSVGGGVGYEITGLEEAILIPLLFEDAQMQTVMKLRPERYRTLQRAVTASPLEGAETNPE